MQRRSIQYTLLCAVVVLAAVLRLYQLKDLPAGLFCDEAALGYNAYAIGTSGLDENGLRLPLYVWSFGGYKNPIYIYAAALPTRLFGLDEFTTRLPAALFGIGTVIAIFFLGRALFSPWVGLFAAVFLTLCPWHLHFSRIAFELISFPFLFVIGATLLVRFIQGRKTLWAAMLFFGLCPYAYVLSTIFIPLFLLAFTVLYLPTLWRRRWETVLAFLVIVATVTPAGYFMYTHPQGMQYAHNTSMLTRMGDWRVALTQLGRNYVEFFSPEFLLQRGDTISRHAVRGFGELLPVYAPFVILGALVCLLYRDRVSKLVLWWMVVYPVGASTMTEIPSASHGIFGVAGFCLLAGIGLAAALRIVGWIGHWRPLALVLQTAGLAAAGYFLVPQVHAYLHAYWVDYPKYSAPTYGGFQYGYRDTIHYMESQRSKYDLLMLTAVDVNQPQIFPLFYNHMDARKWAASGHSPTDLGYLILDPAEYSRYSMDKRILYQLNPGDLQIFTDYDIQKKIVAPGGQLEYVIAEVRTRKRYLTHWLVLGPFLNNNNEGVHQDFIDVQHLTKDRYKGAFGDIYWRDILPQFVRVDLNRFYATADPRNPGNPENVCAYAVTTLRTSAPQSAFLELGGSEDYAQAWLNGRSLTPSALLLAETPKRRPIELQSGINMLVVKSCENIGSWYFTARITDADGKDLPDVTAVAEIPVGDLPVAPLPPDAQVQLVEGFDSIVAFKHTQTPYPDYRGGTQSWWTYLHDDQGEVVWRSAPCPDKGRTIVALTASMSDEPGAADLFVNGHYALTFDIGGNRGIRNWERGPYHMTFMSKAAIAGNSGVILIDVPATEVTAGQPIEFRVVPSGAGTENFWFMIKSYRDTVAYEHLTPQAAAETIRVQWTSPASADAAP